MFRQYFGVLGSRTNRELVRLAVDKHGQFRRSKTSSSPNYPGWRRSTVIYEDQLVDFEAMLKAKLLERLPEVLESLQLPRFDIANFELQLTSHNDGEYYKWHTDNSTPQTAARVVSFVYYFHENPKRYSGGELVLHPRDGKSLVVEPRNDSLVMFASHSRHEVRPVVCPTKKFEHGRFTLNGWIRRQSAARSDDCFGYGIFAPYAPRRAAAATAENPASTSSTQAAVATSKLESLLDVHLRLQSTASDARAIDTLPRITHRRFVDDYYARNRPFVLKGRLKSTKAVKAWSPRYFSGKFGDAELEITANRARDPLYERHFHDSVRRVSMREFCARLEKEPESNDFYLVARNFLFDVPGLAPLRAEVSPPREIVNADDLGRGTMKMWFGPKGTVTPLHHDEHSILFTQIHGRKQFKMIPSMALPRMYVQDRYYSAVDPEKPDPAIFPDFPFDAVRDVTLEPGDVLFIPVGWWHWVRSLDVSISVTYSSFRVPGRNTGWKSGG